MKSKREQEEEKKKADEEAAAKVYEDFYNTFVEVPDQKTKVWVKAGTFDAGSRKEDTREKGKLYKPTSKLEELRVKFSSAEKAAQHGTSRLSSSDKPDRPGKKKETQKRKSNLELFKEELKMIQEERAERHRIKGTYHRDTLKSTRFEAPEQPPPPKQNYIPNNNEPVPAEDSKSGGSYDCGDPTTTNLYLGNLSPKITEQRLMELFGRFGPLASIKIMWPRTDDERSRGRNCGFVAFMNRKDGERSLAYLNGRDIDGFEMKLGWGKAVPIPPHPIYIPPALVELTLPPPPSGLPFNCQPSRKDTDQMPPMGFPPTNDPEKIAEMEKILQRAVVKVVIPTERTLLQLIHRMIEFVIREGPMFEAMIMNKELNNPDFRFLFENQSPAHVYYRWKLLSILQGDSQSKWSTKPFRMFKNGSIWKPPPLNPFSQGMPEELIRKDDDFDDKNKKGLSNAFNLRADAAGRKQSLSIGQRKRLESMIRILTPEKDKIGEAMVWCIEHAEAAHEICQCLTEALTNIETAFPKRIARLYLISDILHNCSVKISNASFFRKYFQEKLFDIVEGLHESYSLIESRIRAEQVKQRVMKCFRVWEDWAVYPHDFLIKLQNIFLGIDKKNSETKEEPPEGLKETSATDVDVDGIPLDDVDGFPLKDDRDVNGTKSKDGAVTTTPLIKNSAAISALQGYDDDFDDEEDIDGAPMDDDLDGMPLNDSPKANAFAPGFVPSKWESVSPKRVESQAMTLSKWDELENQKSGEDASGSDTTPVYDQPSSPKADSSTKKYDVVDDEDLDGIPIEYEDYKRKSQSSEEEEDSRSQSQDNNSEDEEDSRGFERLQGDSEERRSKLRAVEIKVLQYQDELEKGIRSLKQGYSLHRQVQHYRHKLIKKIEREECGSSERRSRKHRSRSSSPEEKKSRKRSRSPHKSSHRVKSRSPRRHRSRSPRRRRSHSRSPPRKHKKKSRH